MGLTAELSPLKRTADQPLQEWLAKIQSMNLPVLNGVLSEIKGLAKSDDASIYQLSEVILRDPNLTSQVLRIANTALYNPASVPINTVSRATVVLGTGGILSIAISALVADSMNKGGRRERLMQSYGRSFHAAVQARNLMTELKSHSHREEIFIAGLLCNIGELTLWCCDDPRIDQLDQKLAEGAQSVEQSCMQTLGVQFKSLSRGLAKQWDLGEVLQDALSPTPRGRQAQAVLLGEQVSRAVESGWDGPELGRLLPTLSKFMGCEPEAARESLLRNAQQAAEVVRDYGLPQAAQWILQPRAQSAAVNNPLGTVVEVFAAAEQMTFERCDINGLLKVMVEGMHQALGLDRVVLAVLNGPHTRLTGKYAAGSGCERLFGEFLFALDEGRNLFTELLATQKPMLVDSERNAEQRALLSEKMVRLFGSGAFLLAPIGVGHRRFGLFYADRSVSGVPLTAADLAGFRQLAQHTTLCLGHLAAARG